MIFIVKHKVDKIVQSFVREALFQRHLFMTPKNKKDKCIFLFRGPQDNDE